MRRSRLFVLSVAATAAALAAAGGRGGGEAAVTVRSAVAHDTSLPLLALLEQADRTLLSDLGQPPRRGDVRHPAGVYPAGDVGAGPHRAEPALGVEIEQTNQGTRPPLVLLDSFDGHGFGTAGPHGPGAGNNPSDNSLAVGPDHVVETVNSRIAVYSKKGRLFDTSGTPLFGPIGTNVIWNGFGGECERAPNGDAVVRWDQLAERWLIVMPLFRRALRPAGEPQGPYGMCYAVSTSANPMGAYHRYYFERELFPDYPRPAVWPDGWYIPTSTGDDVIEKHACVIERSAMLEGRPAREQCIIIRDVNFLNNADIDGWGLPPAGAPNIMMATGGTQLREVFTDDGVYVWNFHVDWENPSRTRVEGPRKIQVAPYHYLCNGQLTRCVPQPDTDMRLDAQGDKIMQRLVYRNIGGSERIVAVHSVNTAAGAGGVRWYEFRLDGSRNAVLHQQGTYAPDGFYRWMASPAMDRQGNIGIGYSFGGTPHYAGQRFSGRLADDPPGQLTFHESVIIEGKAAQTNTLRWQDYVQTAVDPDDDCTIWYVGDYLKENARSYTARIASFRLPDCLRGSVSGSAWFDVNRNGVREPNEPGLPGWRVTVTGTAKVAGELPPASRALVTDSAGNFHSWVPVDAVYYEPRYTISAQAPPASGWVRSENGVAYTQGGTVRMSAGSYSATLRDREEVGQLGFGFACTVTNAGANATAWWAGPAGGDVLRRNEPQAGGRAGGAGGGRGGAAQGWRGVVNATRFLVRPDGTRFTVEGTFDEALQQFANWLRSPAANPAHAASLQLAAAALNVAYGTQDGAVAVQDPVAGDWVLLNALLGRVSTLIGEASTGGLDDARRQRLTAYARTLESLNANTLAVTPATPARCAR